MKRYIIIGDVHGCIDELRNLLRTLVLTPEDQIIFVGDLVDKGPRSAEVVAKVRQLSNHYDVVLVEGNHEEKHRRFRRHLARGLGKEKTMKNYEELSSITSELTKEDIAFLNNAVLYHKIKEYNAIVVHAGISPSINYIPSYDDLARMGTKKRKHFLQMLRVRYVNPKGYMVMLGHETDEDVYWAETYDGRWGKVFFGHQPFYQDTPKEYENAVGLDLGCVFGNKLCAAVLSEHGVEYVTVDALKQYAKKMGES